MSFLRLLLSLSLFVRPAAVQAQWGAVDCGDYYVILIRHDPQLIGRITGILPVPGAQSGVMVDLRIKPGVTAKPDAYEVTLRYVDKTGKRWSRTQVLRATWPLDIFFVGDVTPLSVSVRPVYWQSVPEAAP